MSVFKERQRRYERLGGLACGVFVVAVVLCGTFIRITGAVSSSGYIVQAGENKSVQHTEGGSVSKIMVENGDLVEKGQPLLVLNAAAVTSQFEVLRKRRFELEVIIARIEALTTGKENFRFEGEAEYPDIVTTQEAIFSSQRSRVQSAQMQLSVRMEGLDSEMAALKKQIATSSQQLEFLNESIVDIQALYDEKLVSKARLTALQREKVAVFTELDALALSEARLKNAYNDAWHQSNMLVKENLESLWREMEQTREEANEVDHSLEATNDRQSRLIVTAPASGRVHELTVKNEKAVVAPGETILKIVPISTGPTIIARVNPMDIDQVYVGQDARVRFVTFDSKNTPEIAAEVLSISPDRITDEQSGEIYYSVYVSLPEDEIAKIKTGEVIPGLPVTAMLTTADRTLLDYLIKPLKNQLFSAFRED